jgi:hypothetical protein
MNARKFLTVAGMAAGAAVGATSLYVAMRPRLRKDLKKKGLTKDALSLIGHEMKKEATDVAHDMRGMLAEEAKAATRLPRRWLRRRVKAGQQAAREADEALRDA